MRAAHDRIIVHDIRVAAAVGAEVAERRTLQELRLDLEIGVDLSGARRFDRLDATVDYAALHARVVAAVGARPVALLERVAELVLAEVVRDDAVLWARVEVAKVGLLAGATPSVVIFGRRPTRIAVGLGANIGDAPATIAGAVDACAALGPLVACSSLYLSKPWGMRDQADFHNAAIILETTLMPHAVLAALKAIERRAGRTAGARYGPRVLDCDLLDDDGAFIDDGELTVPHPRLTERAFVLAPLAEIAARYRPAYDCLPESERLSIVKLAEWPVACANPSQS